MEVVTTVGGAILAPLFQSLVDSFKANDLFTYARGSQILEEVSKWEPMLRTIFAVLDDTEEQLMTNGVVRSWFNDLSSLAYDVDDVLDELLTHSRQRKFRAETSSSKVGKLVLCGLSLTSGVKFSSDMASKVQKVSQRLREVKERMEFTRNVAGRSNRVTDEKLAMPLPTASLVVPKVCGRDDDQNAILDMMKTEAGKGGVAVIPIVGMGGVGKTTLAQMVYNDDSLQFDFKAWASVGEDFDLTAVTKKIIPLDGDLDFLQSKLREKLFNKKYLIVLDDLWSVDYVKWEMFYRPFASGALGSKIIVTTRSKDVSLMTSTRDGYLLQSLSYDDSLSLLAHHALGQDDFTGYTELMEVGQQIVKRCDGLPLAVKALGGLLRGRTDPSDWKRLLENKLWGESSKILPALRLSYYHLPPHLKWCFAFCSIFPKKYEFGRHDLVLLWLAEGFLQHLSQGYDYLDELFGRSLFQKSATNASVFVMHDLINDLARSVGEPICFNLEEGSGESYVEVRHSAFNRSEFDVAPRLENFQKMERVRTILALPIFEKSEDSEVFYISSKVLDDWIPKLKRLRVLSLSGYAKVDLPKSISVLQHLRYLNLCGAELVTLPATVTKLFNLQVLILQNCKNLRKLPADFCDLINLQCVDLRGTDNLDEMPLHIGNLLKLHIFTKFIVGSIDGRRIEELLKISKLQGRVHIKELQNVMSKEVGECMKMKEKEKIDGLALEWSDDFDVGRDDENEKEVLEALQPQNNVAKLSIMSYGGIGFPSWFGNDSFKITFIEIYNCRNVSSLPPLGRLPLLKELSIEEMPGVKEVGVEFYGKDSPSSSASCFDVFPSLEILNFKDMVNWKLWSGNEGLVFPKLRKLGVKCCPELSGDFPKSLDSLEELVIEGCKVEILKPMPSLKSITKLEIIKMLGRVSFDVAFPQTMKSLQELQVMACDDLQHIWENGTEIQSLSSLKELTIMFCEKLVSFVEGEDGVFPANFQSLVIFNCDTLEKLPGQLHSLTSFTKLMIFTCPKLATIGVLPDIMKEVRISDCESLATLPDGIMVDQNGNLRSGKASLIEELTLSNEKPDTLIVPSNELFPAPLSFLYISGGLETQLLGSVQSQSHLSRLTTLHLIGATLESFPASGLPIPTLLHFDLDHCENLVSLPCNIHELTSLQYLCLKECPKIECFPENGLPPSLNQLVVSLCESLERQPLSKWRLNRLLRLQRLTILGAMEMVTCFPDDSLPLPTSITSLFILCFGNLKSISSSMRKLTSLRELYIGFCVKLRSLPKEGLPPSLGRLRIAICPLLEKQCKRKNLAHIPDLVYSSDPTSNFVSYGSVTGM